MLLKEYFKRKDDLEKYEKIKEIVYKNLKKLRINKNSFNKIEVKDEKYYEAYYDFFDDQIVISRKFLNEVDNLKELSSVIVHEIAHQETYKKSKFLKKIYIFYNEFIDDEDYFTEDSEKLEEYSFKHTRKFLFNNVESYSYDYEFGVFYKINDLDTLTKKQFDQLSLCILKDFLEDEELFNVDTLAKSIDETISFCCGAIVENVKDRREYNEYICDNRKIFAGYSLKGWDYKSYLFDHLNLNKIIIDELFDTYNHSRVVKTAEKIILSDDLKEIIGKGTLKKLEKI